MLPLQRLRQVRILGQQVAKNHLRLVVGTAQPQQIGERDARSGPARHQVQRAAQLPLGGRVVVFFAQHQPQGVRQPRVGQQPPTLGRDQVFAATR